MVLGRQPLWMCKLEERLVDTLKEPLTSLVTLKTKLPLLGLVVTVNRMTFIHQMSLSMNLSYIQLGSVSLQM